MDQSIDPGPSPVGQRLDAFKPTRSVSPAQARIWFLEQLHPGQSPHNLPLSLRLSGWLETAPLERALEEMLRLHEPLRTAFRWRGGQLVPAISPTARVALRIEDLSAQPQAEAGARVKEEITRAAHQPFDLSRGPFLRAKLFRLGPEEHALALTFHRIAADEASIAILYREWVALYEAFIRGLPSPLADPPMTFAEAAASQRIAWERGGMDEALAFWEHHLGKQAPVLDLPADRPRPPRPTFNARARRFALRPVLAAQLKALAQNQDTTLYMLLLAAFQSLLHRYSGQDEIWVGSSVPCRVRPELNSVIGPFANTLVRRADFSGAPTFQAVLGQVRQTVLAGDAHQEVPLEQLLEMFPSTRNQDRSLPFQVTFDLQSEPLSRLEAPGLSIQPLPGPATASMLDLALAMEQQGEEISGRLTCNSDLFDAETMVRMLCHYQVLLEGVVREPDQSIARLPILTGPERHELITEWNDTKAEYPRGRCVHELFEAQVQRTPDAVAVVFEDQALTYRELNERADTLARELRQLGVGPDVRVGISMARSLEMVIGLYGIHKAGGAYVPMDPTFPAERVAFMLEDAQVPVLLTQEGLVANLPAMTAKILCLEPSGQARLPATASSRQPEQPQAVPHPAAEPPQLTPDHLAYVIYTSGSTGKPKGVQVRHRNAVNFFTGMDGAIGGEPGVWLAVTSISFDISVLELFWTLTRGFKVVVQGDEGSKARLAAWSRPNGAPPRGSFSIPEQIVRHGVTHLQCTPSLAGIMLEDPKAAEALKRVKTFLFGGEPLPPALVGRLAGYGEIFNMYGPTETTVWSTCHPVTRHGGAISIGRPIANTEIYILDRNLQPVPIGISGELFIGGAGVVRGYLNRPELTAERFIPHPFSTDPAARLYRTGDLARYQPDGNIEFLGRLDFQVKVRGFRIELGEIETALRQYPMVKEALVSVWEPGPNDKRLVGYYVTQDGAAAKPLELRRFLKSKLPEYMVPSAFMHLQNLPLTPNGKVDRKALPVPEIIRAGAESGFATPPTPLEQAVAAVWQEVLRMEQIGVQDNFFDLGGRPLLALEAHARLRERLGREFPPRWIFEFPTPGLLAKRLEETAITDHLPPTNDQGLRPRLTRERADSLSSN